MSLIVFVVGLKIQRKDLRGRFEEGVEWGKCGGVDPDLNTDFRWRIAFEKT